MPDTTAPPAPPAPPVLATLRVGLVLVVLQQRQDRTVTVHTDREAALDSLAWFADEYWSEVADCDGTDCGVTGCEGLPPTTDGLDRDRVIALYFEHHGDEDYTIDEQEQVPLEVPAGRLLAAGCADQATTDAAVTELDADTRDRLARALDAARSRDRLDGLLRLLRAELAAQRLDRAVGVLFTTDEADEGWFFDHVVAQVVSSDGDTDTVSFSDAVRAALTEEYGRRGRDSVLAVDLRTGDVGDDEDPAEDRLDLHARFRVPAPDRT